VTHKNEHDMLTISQAVRPDVQSIETDLTRIEFTRWSARLVLRILIPAERSFRKMPTVREGPNPSGKCMCGCKKTTPISTQTHLSKGLIKGCHTRYCCGHSSTSTKEFTESGGNRRKTTKGYISARHPDHPRATNGFVYEHILVAEKALGKYLPHTAEVHHVNEVNNIPSNLVICQDAAYHKLLHARTRALKACGNPNYRKCTYCQTWDHPKNLSRPSPRGPYYHRQCCKADALKRSHARRQAGVML
jgi:hypothetical protein